MAKIKVIDTEITIVSINENDYISITDIAKHKTDEQVLRLAIGCETGIH